MISRLARFGWRRVLLVLVGICMLRQWVWMPVLISGHSMEPTFHNGQFAGVNKIAYALARPRRGEVVALWTGQELAIKRILGLPGEELGVCRGVFQVNGESLREPYVQRRGVADIARGRIEPGCYVVAGDNRDDSFIAVVRQSRIVGRVGN